jgi:uncharacterized protein
MAGEVVHLEIPADDTGKAREFWGGLFGWQFESFPGPSEYHMMSARTSAATSSASGRATRRRRRRPDNPPPPAVPARMDSGHPGARP